MGTIRYRLSPLGVIDRWLVAGVFERHVAYEPTRIEQGERFVNSWAVAGVPRFENPARRRLARERRATMIEMIDASGATPGGELEYEGQRRSWTYWAPFGNPWVEHSEFWWLPTHLAEWAFTTTEATRAHRADLRIRTAGRVRLWLNGAPVTDVAPFSRNSPVAITCAVDLVEGPNRWLVYHEDLAERDTGFKFRVDYLGSDRLRVALSTGRARPAEVRAAEAALADAHFDADTTLDGDVMLRIVNPLGEALPVEVRWWREWGVARQARHVLAPRADHLVLGSTEQIGEGILTVEVTLQVGPVRLGKAFVQQVYPAAIRPGHARDAPERRRRILEIVARSGVDDLHKAHAMLRTGAEASAVAAIVEAETGRINGRLDCSDFSLIGAFRLWSEFRDRGILREELWQGLKAAILGFRYWCDEPGDDVMWFFSENHALLFHAAELLAGQLFPDELFTNDRVPGRVHCERGKRRLEAWLRRFRECGVAEWNSNAYIPIDLMGLLTIFDLAEDRSLRESAREALDATLEHVAASSVGGVLATTQGRTYELELKGDYCNPMSCINWMAFGTGHPNSAVHGTVGYAVSSYEPPASAVARERLLRGRPAVYRIHQGPAGHADLYTYRVGAAQLSSAVHHRPGARGYQEHVVQATLGSDANVWINHPGELVIMGSGRPGYWAGNGILPDVVQYHGLAIVSYDIPGEEEIDFTHAYFPMSAFDDTMPAGSHWWFARRDDSYVGVYAHHGLQAVGQGQSRDRELRSRGRRNVWLLRLGDKREFRDYRSFCEVLGSMAVRCSPELTVEFADPTYGPIRGSWNGSLLVDGAVQPAGESAYPLSGALELLE